MPILCLALCAATFASQDGLPPLGTNLAAVADWSTQWPLVDAFKTARPWIAQKDGADWGKGDPLVVDENGNVKSLKPGQFAETVLFSNGHHPLGDYTLLWKGKGTFEGHLGCEVKNASDGKATLTVTGDKGIFLMLKSVDPGDPPREIKLILPGHAETFVEEPFHPVFLQRMSLYPCLRFMDWGATNDSRVRTWAQRARPEQATYTQGNGVPIEVMIGLANAKSAMPWFCVPHQADDGYVREMAKLIKSRLNPDLKVVVEYSNECWNSQFSQQAWCAEQGKKLKLGDRAALRFYAQRSTEIFSLFEKEFGGTSRLVRVLSAQASDPSTATEILEWKGAYRSADALAIAPYFGSKVGAPDQLANTVAGGLDGIFATMMGQIADDSPAMLKEYAKLARSHGLKLLAYEGGQHLVGLGAAQESPELNELLDKANRDPRMRAAYGAFLKLWRDAGGLTFMHFNDCGPFSKHGRWGTIEWQDQDPSKSMKNQALIQYALFPDR